MPLLFAPTLTHTHTLSVEQDAIAATEEAEACTSKDAEARWIAVNDSEKIEKSISELQK